MVTGMKNAKPGRREVRFSSLFIWGMYFLLFSLKEKSSYTLLMLSGQSGYLPSPFSSVLIVCRDSEREKRKRKNAEETKKNIGKATTMAHL